VKRGNKERRGEEPGYPSRKSNTAHTQRRWALYVVRGAAAQTLFAPATAERESP
jgi:hypothetical protein